MAEKFEQWCILEIMGHQRYSGFVTEQAIGGSSFVRIDVPECGDKPAFTKIFGAASVYAISPVSEEIARSVAAGLGRAPVSVYDLPAEVRERLATPALTGPADDDDMYDRDIDGM